MSKETRYSDPLLNADTAIRDGDTVKVDVTEDAISITSVPGPLSETATGSSTSDGAPSSSSLDSEGGREEVEAIEPDEIRPTEGSL